MCSVIQSKPKFMNNVHPMLFFKVLQPLKSMENWKKKHKRENSTKDEQQEEKDEKSEKELASGYDEQGDIEENTLKGLFDHDRLDVDRFKRE